MLDFISWTCGCINMTASLIFSTIGYHKKGLDEPARNAMTRATNVHQLASLGFFILAYQE